MYPPAWSQVLWLRQRFRLIYRGNYIINWCQRCHTALADLEVEHEEHDGH
ncbi:MAG: class I tRNA ligase family protein, partial [Proteobacteria bacterium]|nr:class I tRNA ligase family protein [Pseudomonadota bacterium]